MSIDETERIAQIETRVCELQKSYLGLQEEFSRTKNSFERSLDNSALYVIDILDMLDTITTNLDLDHESSQEVLFISNKVKNRLNEILRHWQVQEIIFSNNSIETGKVRVLETQQTLSNLSAGTIIKICRKGYCRGDKVIRPADVITA